jgi:V8-like Glu-specific endopeptidase
MIGPHTAATAAHCVFQNGYYTGIEFGGNYCDSDSDCMSPVCTNHVCGGGFVLAFDSAAPRAPFGTNAPVNIFVPSGWTSGGDFAYDYAMLEFAPNAYPGNTVGWFGTYDSSSGVMAMAGYPQDKDAGHQMWYKEGFVTGTTATRRKHNVSFYHGDSGAALFIDPNGIPYLVGIGSTENYDCFFSCDYWNEATRWDTTVYSYFHTASGGSWP